MQKTFIEKIQPYAPSILRIAMAAIVLWFGTQQMLHSDNWTAYVPDSAVQLTHLKALTLVYINGAFELIFGLLLLIGWKTRIVALLIALHLLDIMWVVGYGEIGVRDFGLAMATIAVAIHGPDEMTIS